MTPAAREVFPLGRSDEVTSRRGIMGLAGPNEVFVSDTTRTLIESPEVSFTDRGEFELKGLGGSRHVFSVS